MKRILTSTLLLLALLALPTGVLADGDENLETKQQETPSRTTETVCTTTYGGGTECREVEVYKETVVHKPVDTGLTENLTVAAFFFGGGFIVMLIARKLQVL